MKTMKEICQNGYKNLRRILWTRVSQNTETHPPVLLVSHLWSIYTHFPKDRNCDICLRIKITRAPCRKRTGTVEPRADFLVICGDARTWCAYLFGDGSWCFKLCFSDVRFFSSQVHECVCFGRHNVNCVSLSDPVWNSTVVAQHSVCCARVSDETVSSRKSHVFISSHMIW